MKTLLFIVVIAGAGFIASLASALFTRSGSAWAATAVFAQIAAFAFLMLLFLSPKGSDEDDESM